MDGGSWGALYVLTEALSFQVRYLLLHLNGLFKSYLRPRLKPNSRIQVSRYQIRATFYLGIKGVHFEIHLTPNFHASFNIHANSVSVTIEQFE